jgi:SAM-dependent methyltransferase
VAARGFGAAADVYERARPGYPPAAVAWLTRALGLTGTNRVAELGAGTGKLTRELAAGSWVVATEPLANMRGKLAEVAPGAAVVGAAAEALPLADGSVDAVVAAQAFHWFDGSRVLAEIHRVLRRRGRLGMVWNAWDDTVDWVADVHAVIDRVAGDVPRYRTGAWRRPFKATRLFTPLVAAAFDHSQAIDAATMLGRVESTSFVAAMPDEERRRALDEVAGVLAGVDGPLLLPHRTDAYWCEAR